MRYVSSREADFPSHTQINPLPIVGLTLPVIFTYEVDNVQSVSMSKE
jgi:hypothetical protein